MTTHSATAQDVGFQVVDTAVGSARQLGGLDPSATWALISLVLFVYLWYTITQHRNYDKVWQDIRLREAQADATMALAVGKMADELSRLRVIVDERIPRRGR